MIQLLFRRYTYIYIVTSFIHRKVVIKTHEYSIFLACYFLLKKKKVIRYVRIYL